MTTNDDDLLVQTSIEAQTQQWEGSCRFCQMTFTYPARVVNVNGRAMLAEARRWWCDDADCTAAATAELAERAAAELAAENEAHDERRRLTYSKWVPGIFHGRARTSDLVTELTDWHPGESLYLYGDVGTGKTHQIAALMNRVAGVVPFEWYSVRRLIADATAAISNKRVVRPDIFAFPTRPDVLVLDDLGAERATEFAIFEVGNLIDARYHAGKVTVVTANYSLAALLDRAVQSAKHDDDPLVVEMDRITSRLAEMTTAPLGRRFELTGVDRRVKP